MKRCLFLVAAAVLCLSSQAQEAQPKAGTFSLVPRLGVSVNRLSGQMKSPVFSDRTMKAGYNSGVMGGLDAWYQASKQVGLSVGVFYALQGSRYKNLPIVVKSESDVLFKGTADTHINLGYLNVPLMVHCYVLPGLALQAGLQPGFRLGSKLHYTYTEYTDKKDAVSGEWTRTYLKKDYKYSEDVKDDWKSLDLSVPVGLSYEYMNVLLDARYNIGLTNVSKADGTKRNEVFLFSVGYRFKL